MASNFKNLPDIATIQPERLIKYRISEDKFSAEVLLPGLWYTDFDKKIGGKVNLWSILKLYESVRWSSLMHGALYYPELCHGTNHTLFIAGERSVLAKKMSEMVFDSHFGFRVPMHGVLYASQIGKSSFSLTATLCDYKTGDEILTSVTKLVYVSNATRKPSPLPEYFLKGAKEHLTNIPFGTIDRKSPSPVLGTAFRHTSKVLHSDCDLNLHANQSVYLRWCSDAGTKAALNGHLRQFRRHIELYPLKSMNNHYIGEALVNSEIVVNVWEDPERLRCLHFVITSNTKVIFTLDLEYFDGGPVKVAPHLEAKL